MDWKHRRLLELAGLTRRRTPDHLLTEGEDEGGDDLFGGDDEGGGDDLFGGDDEGGDEEGGDDTGGGAEEEAGSNRQPPENLKPSDIEKFGSPRFLDIETKLKRMFNDSMTSASVGAQEVEAYPGNAIPEEDPTPAKDPEADVDEEEEAVVAAESKEVQLLKEIRDGINKISK